MAAKMKQNQLANVMVSRQFGFNVGQLKTQAMTKTKLGLMQCCM